LKKTKTIENVIHDGRIYCDAPLLGTVTKVKVKVKESLNRPGVAQGVPGG
jgi:hypothetical protein